MSKLNACLMITISMIVGCNQGSTTGQPLANDSYQTAIESLAEGTPENETKLAIAHLENANTKAFPALISHLDDTHLASTQFFQRAIMDENGEIYHPRICDACFDILQGQIEGNWPKGFRQFYVLNPSNIAEWWSSRTHKSLNELQVECARASLEAAKQEFANNDDEFCKRAIDFLQSNLDERLSTSKSNMPSAGEAFSLDCILFQLPPNFFEDYSYVLPQPKNGAIMLTESETPFVTSRRRPRPRPVNFDPNQPKRLSDTYFTEKYDEYWVEITGSKTGDKIHLRISSSKDSKLRLESDISADIPVNGSVIIKSSNPISGECTEFLQIIGRAHK